MISSIFSIRFSNFFISDFNFSFSWFEKVKFKSCIVLCFWCSFKQKIHKFWLQFKQYEEKVGLADGENKIIVTVYNNNGIKKEARLKYTKK